MDASVAVPANGMTQHEPLVPVLPAPPTASAGRGHRWWDGSRRGLGAVATVALVVVTLIGGYWAISSPESGNDGAPGRTGGLVVAGTPSSAYTAAAGCDRYAPTCPAVHTMGRGFVNTPDYSDAELAARKAQLQGWSLDPGARIELTDDSTSGVRGAIVDVVIEGVYIVTVDGPAVISRAPTPIAGDVEYVKPGSVAELGRGDSISYPAGRARTIVNPLSTITLRFKSAVFYDGDVTLTRPADPQPAGVRVQVDGDGVLPGPVAEYQTVTLDYIEVLAEFELPNVRSFGQRIIGPVDPDPEQDGLAEEGLEGGLEAAGYVLWVGRQCCG